MNPRYQTKKFKKKPRQHMYVLNWVIISTIVFPALNKYIYIKLNITTGPAHLVLFHKDTQKKAVHLKGFTEHVFAFFTPQQVDDHLFAVQPPQCSEMSGLNKQKHCENNITKYIHLTWKSFAERDYFKIWKCRIVCGDREKVCNMTWFSLLCFYNVVDWLISSQCFRELLQGNYQQ